MSNSLETVDNITCTDGNNSDMNNELHITSVEKLDKNKNSREVDLSKLQDSKNTDRNKELIMSIDKLGKSEKTEFIENVSGGALQSDIQVFELDNNIVDEVGSNINTTNQSTDVVGNTTELLNYDSEDDILPKTIRVKKKKIRAVADSDSDEENVPLATPLIDSDNEDISEPIVEDNKKKKHRRLAIVDSDSDIENEVITPHNKSFSDVELNISSNSKEQAIYITNSKGELEPEASNDNFTFQKSRLSALCDSESSDEGICNETNAEEYNINKEEIKPKPYKKKSKPKKDEEENPRKMTGKEAAELRREIKSESQRRVREKNVSLPYHKPKSHTLKEFLARRSKLVSATSLSAKVSPSVAIKMSSDQLTVITKKLKEREKEVKEFYKSESESEDDNEDKDYIPPTQDKEESQENNFHDNKSENIDPVVPVSDEIKDNGQDSGIDMQEICNKLKDHSDEASLTKLANIEENRMIVEENTNQVLEEIEEEIITSEKDNLNSKLVLCPENDINNLNVSDKLNDKMMEISKETEEECNDSETMVEDSPVFEVPELNISDDLNNKESEEQIDDSETVTESNSEPKELELALNTEDSATGYEFNLDDLEENSERPIKDANDVAEKQKTGFQYTDLDREIENFGSNDDKTSESPIIIPKLSKLELIKERLANIKPRLSGGPDDIIDLETGVAKPNDVTRLMERFAQHNLKKHMHKNKVKLSIVSVESGEIHKETVAVNVEEEDNPLEIEEKPGAKLQKLRDQLQNQIAQRRSEFWQNKNRKEASAEEKIMCEEEKEDCGMDDEILDDEEEEAEMTELSEDEEIDDIEEGDRQVQDKKSDFIDEEAEESDADEPIEADNDEDFDAGITEDFPESGLNGDENSKSSEVSEKYEEQPVKRNLRRIVKGFVEDSDDDDENIGLVSKTVGLSEIEKNDFSNQASQDDDYVLPPHQPQSSQTPVRHVITQENSQLHFATPISYITGLQNLNNSASKPSKGSPVTSLFHPTTDPSPLKENNWQHTLQKKLFTDTDITDSQLEGITEISPEKSPNTQETNDTNTLNEEKLVNSSETSPSTLAVIKGNETQLAELCSGSFPSTLEAGKENVSPDEFPSTQDLLNICSGKFTGATQNDSTEGSDTVSKCTTETYTFNTNNEIKSLDADQDMIISQLINEEEMENFKKKFDSPLLSNTQRRVVEEFEEVVGSGGVIDSDDDDERLEVKKKKQKRLMFSDDENSDEDEKEEEVIDLHDDLGSENDEDDVSDVPADCIDYDSEENEIILTHDRADPKLKLSDFFENEAELSESEWGSADEDEKDLDTLEVEQGDAENFDEKKIRSDLERIHMRRLLDDDTREVKMLQELLLEDGELHGIGRERQFRWKNIDLIGDGNEEQKDEDDVYLDEEESEEQWRKKRYEREMFLKEKQEKVKHSEADDLLSDSQLLKIGHKVLQRSQSNSQGSASADKTKATAGSPEIKQPFSLLNKRGSFLSRSDHVLQRLAEYNKVTAVIQGSAKNSRKFLFQTVSLEETSVSINQDKKRKATDGTPKVIKKLRLSDNMSPATSKKNPDKSAKAKLFGNW